MDSDWPVKGTGEQETKPVRAPGAKRPLTELEAKACALSNFPETCAQKAISAFWRRVRISGPEQEVFTDEGMKVQKLKEVEVVLQDGYWSEKANTIHERMMIATLLLLFFESRKDEEVGEICEDLRQLIQRLADKYLWLYFPIVRQTRGN